MVGRVARTLGALTWIAATMIAALGARARAYAQSADVLVWSAPAGCPDREQAASRLNALTGDDDAASRARAEIEIDHAPTGELRARVVLMSEGHPEQRELFGHSCAALSDAALLVVSLGLEGAPVSTAPRQAAPRKPSARLMREPDVGNAQPALRDELELALVSSLALDTGGLPALALGIGGGLVLRAGRTRVELDATYFVPQTVRTLSGGQGQADFGLTAAAARACYTAYRSQSAVDLAVFPCAGVEVGQARGTGHLLGETHDMRAVWSSFLLGLGASLGPSYRLAPVARVELGLPFRRPSFELAGGTPIFQAPAVLARFTLRIELDLL